MSAYRYGMEVAAWTLGIGVVTGAAGMVGIEALTLSGIEHHNKTVATCAVDLGRLTVRTVDVLPSPSCVEVADTFASDTYTATSTHSTPDKTLDNTETKITTYHVPANVDAWKKKNTISTHRTTSDRLGSAAAGALPGTVITYFTALRAVPYTRRRKDQQPVLRIVKDPVEPQL